MGTVRGFAIVSLLAACGCAASPPMVRHAPHDDERDLLALEQRVMDAIRTRDVAALEQIITDDFVLREPSKADVERRAFLEAVRAIPGTIERVVGEGVRARTESDGRVGLITGVQRVRLRLPDGTLAEDAGAFADLCVRRDGQWRMSLAFNVSLTPSSK
jgi:ketosteroid isomerase-like protein